MKSAKRSLKKYNEIVEHIEDVSFSEFMYIMHDAYPDMDSFQKENAYLLTLQQFPETIAYAMLKLSSIKLDVAQRFREEYAASYKYWLEDIEAAVHVGFGDDKIFLTYAKLYIYGMNTHVDSLMCRIKERFINQRAEKEQQEWMRKKIY